MKHSYLISMSLLCLSTITSAHATDLSYQYTVPYVGGGALTITNNGAEPVSISNVMFDSNATIVNNPWGTLWGYKSTLQKTPQPDEINTHYVITENPTITIPPSSAVVLSFNIDTTKIGGPLSPYNAAMDPTNINIKLVDSATPLSIPIQGHCQDTACNDPGNGKRIMGYYPNWAYWRSPKFTADQLPFNKINMVGYAFSIFDSNGNISLYDADSDAINLPMISQARQQFPYLNASLSFGGWSWASTPPGWQCTTGASPQGPAACFSQMAANPTAVTRFVNSAVKAMKEVHFNGIDIDWEYPLTPEDASNYVNLLQKLRGALDAQGNTDSTHYYLTVAVAAGIDKISKLSPTQWQTIAATVDDIGVMTYDFHGAWDQGQTGSNFMSAMALDPALDPTVNNPILSHYNVIDAMDAYVSRGVPKEKLIVGIPVYGRMMNIEAVGSNDGLYQTITGTPPGEWDNQQSGNTGMVDYACIVEPTHCGNGFKLPALTLMQPTEKNPGQYAFTPWGYASNLFITYDDDQSAAYKAYWLIQNGYAGVMLWDLTGDFNASDERSLVNSIYIIFNDD